MYIYIKIYKHENIQIYRNVCENIKEHIKAEGIKICAMCKKWI